MVEKYINEHSKAEFGLKIADGDYGNPYFEFENGTSIHKLLGRKRVYSKQLFDLLLY